MPINYANIPQAMRICPHWVLWKYEVRDGKQTKVPIQPNGRNASSTDPKTWSDFEKVKKFYDMHVADGLGFVFTKDTFSGVDLDHCRDKSTGELDDWAKDYLSKFSSYAEVSPSGEGVHIIVKGAIKEGCTGRKTELKDPEGTPTLERLYSPRSAIEIYSESRFFTVTGDRLKGYPVAVEERQEVLRNVYDKVFLVDIIDESEPAEIASPGHNRQSDEKVLQRAESAKSGINFKELWGGHIPTVYAGDESAADIALMNMLAYWTRKDEAQMERLFSQSGRGKRAKWIDRLDYRERTIKAAVEGRTKVAALEPEEISEEDLLSIEIPANPRFTTTLEPDNFIQDYIRYGETVTDSYQDYWFAGALFCLSVAVNRNVVIKLRQGPVYPNLWINLLGLSSLSRKSTAVDKVDLTIAAANIDPDCKMPDEFSPEAMIERLDKHPRAYLLKDESAGMLAVMKKDYMRGLKDALMQLYDGKDINRELRTSTRKAEKTTFRVKDPYLCLLLATTPGSFAANTELLDVTSGFLPRYLHFFPNHKKDRWMPLEEGVPENDILSAGCQARLIKTRMEFYDLAEPRIIHLSTEAANYFVSWQRTREDDLVTAKDDRKAQFYSRLAVYALKMSMLFTIGRANYANGMEISPGHMQEACRLVDEYFMPMAMTVADMVGKAADRNMMDKIMQVLSSKGGKITRRELMRFTHIKTKDMEESLEALEEGGEIRVVTVSNKRGTKTDWITLSQDSDNLHSVTPVTPVNVSILSQQKESKVVVEGGEPCDSSDTCDTCHVASPISVLDNVTICHSDGLVTRRTNVDNRVTQNEAEPAKFGPHPRKDAPTPPRKPEKCAKCGADLTGHGTVTKNGKVYCAQVGCGYPAREGKA